MLTTLARLLVRHARLVLAVALIALLGAGVVGMGAFAKLKTAGFEAPDSGAVRARAVLATQFGGEPDLVLLVRTPGSVDGPAGAAAGRAVTDRLAAEAGVAGVTSYWTSGAPSLRGRDGRAGLVLAHVAGDEQAAADRTRQLTDAFAGPAPGGATVTVGGGAAIGNQIGGQVATDLARAESVAVPLTLLLLVLAFGSIVAALLPLVISGIAIFGTLAVLAVLASVTDVSVFALNLTTALGLGLGIDYALLMVNRYREELQRGSGPEQAVVTTMATAGRTIIFSGVTVAVALSAMLVFPLYFLRSFAYAGIAVVAIAVAAAVLVLPALLAVLGTRVNAGRLPGLRRWSIPSGESRFWRRIADGVLRRPVLYALPVVVLLVALGTPFASIRFGTPDDRALPTSASTRQVGDALRGEFPSDDAAALSVLVAGSSPAALVPYARRLAGLPDVARVQTATGTYAAGSPTVPGSAATARYATGSTVLLSVIPAVDPQTPAAERLVRTIRSTPAPGASVLVGGTSASLVDQKSAIRDRLPLALGIVALTTLLVLFLFTGSVVLPIKALVLNVLSLSAVFGAMVWIFQQGHLSGLLGFTPGPINTSMPVLLFCIAFGLSMDYEVFLLSRIAELHRAGADTRTAVAGGLARTGRIVSTAAALLAVTFFAFGTSSVSFIKLFGIGTGIAILIDATLIRGVLVPAFMRLAGGANWWAPGPLRRLHARLGLAEAPASEPAPPPREMEPAAT